MRGSQQRLTQKIAGAGECDFGPLFFFGLDLDAEEVTDSLSPVASVAVGEAHTKGHLAQFEMKKTKFAKQFEFHCVSNWRGHYIEYAHALSLINRLAKLCNKEKKRLQRGLQATVTDTEREVRLHLGFVLFVLAPNSATHS
jgi:hypothetical protein